jgi:hypothetical protein
MTKLQNFIDDQNFWRIRAKKEAFSLDKPEDRKELAEIIGFKMEPEVLSCDGECSRSEINSKFSALLAVANQLVRIDPSLKLSLSELY